MHHRRALLCWLAASPLAACGGATWAQAPDAALPAKAAEALDVFDLEKVAQHNIPVAHWGYLMTGVDGEETLKANRETLAAGSCGRSGWSISASWTWA